MHNRYINDRDRLQRSEGELNIALVPIPQLFKTIRSYSLKYQTIVVDSPTMHIFKLQSFGDELNHSQVVVLQPSLIVDLLRESSQPSDHFKWKDRISGAKGLRICLSKYVIQSSDQTKIPINCQIILKWKDRISEVKDLRSHLCEFVSAVGSF
jgi:hypothetical protein